MHIHGNNEDISLKHCQMFIIKLNFPFLFFSISNLFYRYRNKYSRKLTNILVAQLLTKKSRF